MNIKKIITKKEFFYLYNRNSPDNENRNIGQWANVLYRRKISHNLAYYLARFGISANTVTVSSLILAIIAGSIFIFPSIFTLVLIFFAYELVYILDSVDGELARFHGTYSKYGALLDDLSDIFIEAFFVMAFGIRLYLDSHNPLFLILGNLGSISYVFEGLWVKNSSEIVGEFTEASRRTLIYRLRAYLLNINNITSIVIFIFVITILEKYFISINLLEWFFFLYVFQLFITKIFLRYYFILMKTKKVNKTVWKGWKI